MGKNHVYTLEEDEFLQKNYRLTLQEMAQALNVPYQSLCAHMRHRGYRYKRLQKRQYEFLDELTKKQDEVIGLLAQGMPIKQIAEKLFIEISTVKTHLEKIYDKYGIYGDNRRIMAVLIHLKRKGLLSEEAKIQDQDNDCALD